MLLSKASVWLKVTLAVFCCLTIFSFSNSKSVVAQENPSDTPTDIPTELAPTDIPTDTPIPTDVPAPTATEIPTETSIPTDVPAPTQSATDNTPTDVPSPTATLQDVVPTHTLAPTENVPLPPEPPLGQLFSTTFDSGDLSAWNIEPGWSLVPHNGGLALEVFNSTAIASYISNSLMDVAVQASFLVDYGTVRIIIRQTATDSYWAMLDAQGNVNLYRSGTLLQSAMVIPSSPNQWRTLRFSVMNEVLRVSVDGLEVIAIHDSAPLPAGGVSLSGIFNASTDLVVAPQHTVQVDNFAVFVPVNQMPTLAPTATATLPPSATATATFTVTPTQTATGTPTFTPKATSQRGGASGAQMYVVNTTDDLSDGVCDSTHCSLREAITAANANAGTDTISFNIPGSAPFVIKPTLALPTITDPIILDATLQPGYSGSPLVVLDGSNLGVVDGLTFTAAAHPSTIRGFDIVFWGGEGIKTTGAAIIVEANYIGIDYTGNIAQPNGHNGIYIIGSSSRIGGTTAAQRNIISGNLMNGIMIEPSSISTPQTLTQVMGNYIGTNAAGTADVGNKIKGVSIKNADQNIIGGDTSAYRNIISGNDGGAILITGSLNIGESNRIKANYFGTDATGTAVIANGSPIIQISAQSNSVGGCTSLIICNVFAGNGGTGVLLQSQSSSTVYMSYFGVDASGTAPLGSLDVSIDVTGSNNTIGAFNVITNYQTAGIRLSGSQNSVSGNYIGTDPTGKFDWVSAANAVGILVTGANAKSNVIGRVNSSAACTTNCNLISGNNIGISVSQAGTGNQIQGNYIGTTLNGLAALPNNIGIKVDNTSQTLIGSSPLTAGAENFISGNTTDGIYLSTATTTTIQGNYIGLAGNKTAALGNNDDGIELASTTTNTLIGQSNNIASNGDEGIVISSNSTGNRIIQSVIYANGGLGVDLFPTGETANDTGDGDTGANGLQNFPMLTNAFYTGGTTTVSGTLNSKPSQTYIIQFFGNTTCDSSGYGEGEIYLGSTTVNTDATGNISFSANMTTSANKYITATATDASNNTSEFSSCIAALVPPASFKLTVASATAIDLSWVDVSSNENEYHVERSFDGSTNWTEIAVLPADSSAYTDNTITCAVPYYYRVRAYRSSPAQYSGYTSILNTTALCALNAPTALTRDLAQAPNVVLKWVDNATNETGYNIERSPDGTSGWAVIANYSQNGTSFLDNSTVCDGHYFYRVQATHTNGQKSDYSNILEVYAALCKPTTLAATHTVDAAIDLTWNDISTVETAYKVDRSVNGSSTWVELASLPANSTAYSDADLTCAFAYAYRVRAFRALDSGYSAYSNTTTYTLPKCPPADLSLTKTVSNPTPGETETFTYTLSLINDGPNAAANVTVRDVLSTKLIFMSATASQGTYDAATSKWTLGTVAANSTNTLVISVHSSAATQGQILGNTAEVWTSDALDPDSTPANSVSSEDDQSSVNVTVGCAPASVFNVAAGDSVGLIAAIVAANNETCYPGANTINLAPNSTYTLTQAYVNDSNGYTGLPTVSSTITIEGNGSTIQRTGSTAFRILVVIGSSTQPDVGGNLTLNRLTLNNGLANQGTGKGTYGGGILNVSGTLTLTNSTLSGNIATGKGGGIYTNGTTAINSSLFVSNRSQSFAIGAAIMNDYILSVTNSTFSANQNDSSGNSIIYSSSATTTLTILNNTFSDNIALNGSSDIYSQVGATNLRGNIFSDTQAKSCSGNLTSNGYNFSDDTSCASIFTQPTDLNNVTLPMGPLSNNGGYTQTRAPAPGNPAIEAIPAVDCAVTADQAGTTRPQDSDGDSRPKCEVGALELGYADLELQSTVDLTTANAGDVLHFTIQMTNNGPDNALGVTVFDSPGTQLSYISSTPSQGTYDAVSGLWKIGQLNVGATATLAITAQINYSAVSATLVHEVHLLSASVYDAAGLPSDSNSITVAGCSASVTFTVADGDVMALINALDAANNESCYPGSNIINLATNGTYTLNSVHPDSSGESNGLSLISSDIVIEGHGSTIQRDSAASAFRLLMVAAGGHLTLNNTVIKGGSAVNGGAISNAGTLDLNTATLTNNTSSALGGVIYNTGTLNIIGSFLSNNTGVSGGAVHIAGGATATINTSTFTNNSAVMGGAIAVSGSLTLSNSVLSTNQSSSSSARGGALFINSSGTATINNTTFDSNSSYSGGAIYNEGGTLNLSMSTVSGNTASNQGGGLYINGTAAIVNVTFSSNYAATSGGAIRATSSNAQIKFSTFSGNSSPSGNAISQVYVNSVNVTASAFAKNGNSACFGGIPSGGYNVSDDISCNLTGTGDKQGINLLLGTLANNGGPTKTHAPQNGSPVFNNVPLAACNVATDQRGTTRPQGTACDSGAFEGNGTPVYPTLVITNVNTTADTGDGKLLDGEVTDASITQFVLTFNLPVQDPAGDTAANDVTNRANYRLVRDGANGVFQTTDCTAIGGDDILVPINSITYDPNTLTATLNVNGGTEIPADDYRFIACSTLQDINGGHLDGNKDGNVGDPFIRGFSTNPTLYNADLVITQTDTPDPVLVNGTLTYTVNVANTNGPQRASNVVLTDTLPSGVTFVSAPGCSNNSGILTCNLGTILSGETKTLTIMLTVGATTISTLTNTASTTSSTTDSTPANNTNIKESTVANEAPAVNLIVNTTADSTDGVCGLINCSLRDAITTANGRAGTDIISFNISGTATYSIKPLSALPTITEALTIDGWSQPGYTNKPIIEIDGTSAGSSTVGLTITSGGSTIRGLVINNFKYDGLVVNTLGGNTIVGNYIGIDTTGTIAKGNRYGIVITNSPNNIIGGVTAAERNVISGNTQTGVTVSGATSTGNVIRGNFIGTNATGTSGLANDWGISVSASNTTIGGTIGTTPGGSCTGACNLISYSTRTGLGLFGAANNITVQGNFIGTDVTGTTNLGNGSGPWTGNGEQQSGIYIHDGPHTGTIVGGSTPAARNIISGSAIYGIYFATNDAVTDGQTMVQGNYIGTDTTGTVAIPNQYGGIQLYTINNVIKGNLISGNNATGIDARLGPNTIQGNYIGTTAAGNTPLPNKGGISASGQNIIIGGATLGQGNVISGNNGTGISLGSNSIVLGNRIGTDITGTLALGNNGYGVNVTQGSNNIIGGINSGEGNSIVNNVKAGIYIYSTNSNYNAIRGNNIYNNGGLGIDLQATNTSANDGVTPNDTSDADLGGNKLQNFPVLSGVAFSGGQITINGSLNSSANATFELDFYASPTCDALGNGEGQLYLGHSSQTTDGSGNATFSLTQSASFSSGYFVTATATDVNNNTSEFSNCVTGIQPPTNLTVSRISSSEIQLSWVDNSADESSFRIERSLVGFNDWTEIGSVSANVTLFNQTGLNCETTYYYRVRSQVNGSDYSSYSKIVSIRPCNQQGPIFTVTSTANTDDGICEYNDCTLREAINAANKLAGQQTINLASNAVYTFVVADNNTSGSNALPPITGNIVINGNGAIIERNLAEGTPQFRLILVRATGSLTLNDLTLRNGYVQGNTTWMMGRGGGIANEGGQLTVNRSTISNNTADYDSGIGNLRQGTLVVHNSTISNNQGGYGPGGIGNEKEGYYDPAGTVTITNSTISGNVAGSGGAVSNTSAVAGSGVMTIIHSTLANNYSINPTILNGTQTLILRDTIITVNAKADGSICSTSGNPNITSQGYNIVGDNSCNLSGTGDLNNTNPTLSPLANNGGATQTHALQPSSPAIDLIPAGNCTTSIDQRGIARPIDGNNDGMADCDSGAYEASAAVIADLSLTSSVSNGSPNVGDTITYTLTLTNYGPSDGSTITVKDLLATGLTFSNATSSQGTYSSGTGIWDVGTLAANNSVTLSIQATVNSNQAGLTIHNSAEVIQSSALDLDSTPNNNLASEDDQSAVDMTIACGVPPFTVAAGDSAGLIAAINAANNEQCYRGENTITLAAGSTYTLTSVNNSSGGSPNGLPDITSAVIINGNGAIIERSSANGTPRFRFMHIMPTGNLTLNQLTLRNGSSTSYGGGGAIVNQGTLSVADSTFTGNSAGSYDGGAIYTPQNSYLTVTNSSFLNNSAYEGGAISSYIATLININGSTFTGNTSEQLAGAIYNRGHMTITNGTNIENNTAGAPAGAIYNGSNGTLTLSDSTLVDNVGHGAGAIFNEVGTMTIANSTLSGNSTDNIEANGIINGGNGNVTIQNSTLSGGISGGSLIYNYSGTVHLRANILYGTPGTSCTVITGNIISDGYNISDDSSCSVYLSLPTDQNGVNPSINSLANNGGSTQTQSLKLNSPALDALPAELCGINKDQRGVSRPQGSACDIGAYEIQGSLSKPTGLNNSASLTSITLKWNDTFNESEYRVERSPDGLSGWAQITTLTANVTTYTDSSLSCSTTYSYRVRAYRADINLFSPYSNVVTQSTNTCPPADLSINITEAHEPVFAGASQTYTLTLSNLSAVLAQNIVMIDTLPVGTTFQSVSANNPVVCQQANGVVTCNVDVLAGNAQQIITLDVSLNPATSGSITNDVTLSSTTSDPNTANNHDTEVTTINVPPAPPAPTLTDPTSAMQLNTTTPLLKWAAVMYSYNVFSYDVVVDNNADFTSPEFAQSGLSVTSIATSTLAEGTYNWRVRATNILGTSGAWSAVRKFTIDTAPPSVPVLSAPASGVTFANARPTFTWAAAAGANRYRLQVDDDPAFSSPEINVFPITTLSYTLITSLQQGAYNWRVQAYDAADNTGDFSIVRTFNLNVQLTPVNAGVLIATPTITFTWQLVPSATGYQLQVATDAAFTTDVSSYPINTGTTGTLAVSAASVASTYYWRINVNLGSGLVISPFYRSFTAPAVSPLAPALLSPATASLSSSNAVTLTWSAVKDLVGRETTYQIQVDNTTSFASPDYAQTGLNSTFTTTSPLADGVYSWRVRGISTINITSAWSSVRTFTVDTKPPAAPILSLPVTGTTLAKARPTFSWLSSTGANRYRLQVDDDPAFGSPEINSFPITTLSYVIMTSLSQGTYNWRVQAYDAAGNSGALSAVRTFKVNVQLMPANGASLTAAPAIVFTWEPVSGATGYQLQVATDSAFSANLVSYPASVSTLTVPAPAIVGTYYWRINVNLGSGLVTSPFYRSFIAPSAPPPAPSLVSPVSAFASNSHTPTLTWLALKDLVGRDVTYQIQVDNTATFASPEFSATNLNTTAITTNALIDGIYSWRVRAISVNNIAGAWSTVRTFTVDTQSPAAPTLSAPTQGAILANARPTFSWLAATGANRYRLQVDDDPAFGSPEINVFPISGLTYTVATSLQQGTYNWRVQAYDAAGNGGVFSAVRTFKVNIQLTPANGTSVAATPTITFTWQIVPTATGYQLQVATDAAFSANLTNYAVTSGSTGSLVVPAAAVTGTYYWRINVNFGSGLVTSPFYRTFTVPAVAPPLPVLMSPASDYIFNHDSVTLSWSTPKELVGRVITYQIQVDNKANFSSPEYDTSVATGSITTSLANAIYYWRVRAINAASIASGWTAARSFKVAAP